MPPVDDFVITLLSKVSGPRLKALLWRRFYEELARRYNQGTWTFMNYGFWDEDIEHLPLSLEDAANRPFIGLYERVMRGLDLKDKDVVEVGSGRGGGAAYLARTKNPNLMLGLDFSHQATQLAQSLHNASGLRFQQGDALCLPLPTASFDMALNVESSHCYASMPQFLGEVARVLRPGGALLWCDMRLRSEWNEVRAQFAAASLNIEVDTEITHNVVNALDVIAPIKEEAIMQHVPKWLQRSFAGFTGMPGSKVYRMLQSGDILYGAVQARKE